MPISYTTSKMSATYTRSYAPTLQTKFVVLGVVCPLVALVVSKVSIFVLGVMCLLFKQSLLY